VHEHVVAEVDVRLPRGQGILADAGQAEHRLQLGAVAVAQGREAQLAAVAQEHHPAGDADQLAGRGVDGQVRVLLTDLAQRVRAGQLDRIRIDPPGQQFGPLVPPDAQLLR